jgi:hypothetical protein
VVRHGRVRQPHQEPEPQSPARQPNPACALAFGRRGACQRRTGRYQAIPHLRFGVGQVHGSLGKPSASGAHRLPALGLRYRRWLRGEHADRVVGHGCPGAWVRGHLRRVEGRALPLRRARQRSTAGPVSYLPGDPPWRAWIG